MCFRTLCCFGALLAFGLQWPRAAAAERGSGGLNSSALSDAVRDARANHPSVVAARARVEAALARVRRAGNWDDPKIGLESQRVDTTRMAAPTDVEYSVAQRLPLGGINAQLKEAARAEVSLEEAALKRAEWEVESKVRSAWARIGAFQEKGALLGGEESLLGSVSESARTRLGAGASGSTELLQLEVELGRLAEVRAELDGEIAAARADLARWSGKAFKSVLCLPAPPGEAALANGVWSKMLEETRPEILAAKARWNAANAKVRVADKNWVPEVEVRAAARRFAGEGRVREYDAGVTFSVPWAVPGKLAGAQAEALAVRDAARQEWEAAQSEGRALMESVSARWKAGMARYGVLSEKSVPAARQVFESVQVQWEAGRVGLGELLKAKRQVREIEFQQIQTRLELVLLWAEAEAVLGGSVPRSASLNRTEAGARNPAKAGGSQKKGGSNER